MVQLLRPDFCGYPKWHTMCQWRLKFGSAGAEAPERQAGAHATPPIRQGRRAVLRAGFAVVIALLVFSTVEAYRIQSTVTEQHLDIYRDYVTHDEALSRLRRNVLLGSTHVRDFFLSTQTGPRGGAARATRRAESGHPARARATR